MTTSPDLDPIAEAQARVRLRYRRARKSRPIAPTLGRVASRINHKTGDKKLPPIQLLKRRWAEIAGESLAKLCAPEKVTGKKGERSLVLKVIPAAATLVQHQSETIRERVSVAVGGDVKSIKLIQGPLPGRSNSLPKPKRPLHVSPEIRRDVERIAQTIEDPKLRDAIVALGIAVLSEASDST